MASSILTEWLIAKTSARKPRQFRDANGFLHPHGVSARDSSARSGARQQMAHRYEGARTSASMARRASL